MTDPFLVGWCLGFVVGFVGGFSVIGFSSKIQDKKEKEKQ